MPFSNWLHHVAARGCLIAIFCAAFSLSVLVQSIGNDARGQAGADQPQNNPAAENTPSILEAVRREIERVARAIEAQKDDAEAKKKEDRETRDLGAQEDMAAWAKWMFFATCGTVVLTFVGLVLIGRTLIHTRHAAVAARAMVDESKKATAAANEHVFDEFAPDEIDGDGKVVFLREVPGGGRRIT